MQDFHKLMIWQRSHNLTLMTYEATKKFPKEEQFGITGQIRRAAASLPTNIAEGCGRETNADFSRFLQMAISSSTEVEYHLLLARDLGYLSDPDYQKLNNELIEVRRMLIAFTQKVRGGSTESRPKTQNSQLKTHNS